MPVPRSASAPVGRPSGLVPPPVDLSGVTELRLHGVGGSPPERLLDDLAPQQVAGDRIAGFYRTADLAGRHVEAYSWGGLTSRSGTRVLWVLLLPFALANLAGWMCSRATHRSRWRFRLHRAAVRWVGLGLTTNLLGLLALIGLDLVGYQCGGRPGCAGDRWWLAPLRWSGVVDYPGRRVLLGALLPLAVLALLAGLTLRSIRRYEEVDPSSAPGEPAPRSRASAAQPDLGLADPAFWDGRRAALDLGLLHLAAGLAVLGLLVAHTTRTAGELAGAPVAAPVLWLVALAAGGTALAGSLLLAVRDGWGRPLLGGLLASSLLGLAAAGWFAAAQPAAATLAGANLPGLRNATNLLYAGIFAALLLVLLATALAGPRPGRFAGGPLLALVLATALLNVALLAVTVSAARLLDPAIEVYPVILLSLPYLVLVPLGGGLLFGLYQWWLGWRAGRGWVAVRDWYAAMAAPPDHEPGWLVSVLQQPGARRWAAGVARARQRAGLLRGADRLLVAITVAGVATLVAVEVRVWLLGLPVWQTAWTRTLSAYLGVGVPVLVAALLRSGWHSVDSRRRIGVLWDVFTFWPRAYHPLAPPSYAERAVPELQRRLWRIHDGGGRVVLAAHSQGSVLAAAAMLQRPERPPGDRVALVSFGSPLGTLYGWAFPAYVNPDVLRRLSPASGSGVELAGWRNFYYQTDWIGRAVFDPGSPPGSATDLDTELPDPPSPWHIRDQPVPTPRGHSGYWTDPAVWEQVDRFAARSSPGADPVAPGGAGPRTG